MFYDWIHSVQTMASEFVSSTWTHPVKIEQRVMLLYMGPAPYPGGTTDVTTE